MPATFRRQSEVQPVLMVLLLVATSQQPFTVRPPAPLSPPQAVLLADYRRAELLAVIDGDTVVADIDLGAGVWLRGQTVRLARINAPEMKGQSLPAGLTSRDQLKSILLQGQLWLQMHSKSPREKFGRLLGEVWIHENGQWLNASDEMTKRGHAVPFMER